MSPEWRGVTLGNILTLQRGMDLPVQDRKGGTVPIVASTGVVGYHDHAPVKGPGVVIGRSGSIGGGQYVDCDFWPLNTTLWVKDFQGNDRRFCYYLLRSIDFSGMNAGSGVPTLNRNHLHPMPMLRPPLAEQQAISQFLGSLDDRITLLRETNATLEAIAQAMFKSWFVDFDPVRAKQEGRAPEGMDETTAALFPDGFEESELGLVPMEWRVGVLGDIAQTTRQQMQVSDLHADLHYVGLEHIPRKSLSLTAWGNAEGLESAKAAFSEGDILFGKLRPYFHKVVVAPFAGVCSTDILVCQPRTTEYFGVAAMHLFSETLIDYANRLSKRAKMPRVSWKDLAAYPICIPPAKIAAKLNESIRPLIARMTVNTHQAQTLATLRDTLLPRLISGQLRLPEAETMLS